LRKIRLSRVSIEGKNKSRVTTNKIATATNSKGDKLAKKEKTAPNSSFASRESMISNQEIAAEAE
jgi:hypothetical protein